MLNPLKRRIKLNVPLAEISYHGPDAGISFRWNRLRLLIPYHRLPLTASLGSLLEEFKAGLTGDITLYLEGHRLTFYIEISEVKVDEEVIHRLTDFTARIEDVVKQIKSLAEKDALTLEKAQIILYQKGFQFDDSHVHRILAKVIDSLPPRKIVEQLPFPLAHLNYDAGGIRFYSKNTRFEVEKNKLPVEVGPALERIKSNFAGDIIFHIETTCLQQWDSSQGQLQTGQVSREVKNVEMDTAMPRLFRTLRNQLIRDAVKQLIDKASMSPDSIKNLLEEWGLDLKHQEIARELVSTTPPWSEEKDVNVPLKDVVYHDDGIVVPVSGQNIRISSKNLAFTTYQQLEEIKHRFEGDLKIHVFEPFQFVWDEEKEQLTIERQKAVKIKLNIDDETVVQLKKTHRFYFEREEEKGVDVDGKVPEQSGSAGPAGADSRQPDETLGAAAAKETTADKERVGETAAELAVDLPRPVPAVPAAELENKDYHADSIHILEKMADKIYVTTQDLWFRIGDRLVWERPGQASATYIFHWPEEELEFFVGKIWVAELEEIRKDKDSSGYITRVYRKLENLSGWEKNLKRAVKKKG
jgi:hypothetical protein